jgi:hypothetical protein
MGGMRGVRSAAFGLTLLLSVLVPAVGASSVACAAEAAGPPHAALVIDTGGQTLTYCVTLDAPTVSGLRLIQLASSQHGLQYRLGFGGQAVCQLAGIGPSGGDCFGDYPNFWGYWHGNGSGGWTWAGSGAASASIGDGDMEGWSWGSGDSGSTHPSPPSVAFGSVCEDAAPSPSPGGGGSGGGGSGGGGSGGGGSDGGGGGGSGGGGSSGSDPAAGSGSGSGGGSSGSGGEPATSEGTGGGDGGASSADGNGGGKADGSDRANDRTDQATDAEGTDPPSAGSSPSEAPDVTALASATTPENGGPPIAGLVALGAIAALAVGGWFTLRRRNPR